MLIISEKTDKILKEKNLSRYKLSKLIGKNESYINHVFRGERPFSEIVINKILPFLEVTREEFESWILADKYPKEVLKLAIQIKKDFPYKIKSILTTKIDAILQEKKISRTTLSKEIKYGQSGLNQIITRKRTMPKSVLERLAIALEISQDEILSWIVADRYSLQVLEAAYNLL